MKILLVTIASSSTGYKHCAIMRFVWEVKMKKVCLMVLPTRYAQRDDGGTWLSRRRWVIHCGSHHAKKLEAAEVEKFTGDTADAR